MLKAEMLAKIADKIAECGKCGGLTDFRKKNDYWTVPGEGRAGARVVFLGEAPGETEAQTGRPFVGKAGEMLEDMLAALRWSREQVYITNILKCRPPGNRDPEFQEATMCRPFLDLQLKVINPTHIVCLGRVAALNLLYNGQIPELWFSKSLESLRGKIHNHNGRRVICTYHPSYLLRTPEAHSDAWKDLQMLVQDLKPLQAA